MRRIALAALSATLVAPSATRAGLTFGVGTGFSKASGSIMQGARMSDASSGMVPFHLEAGWKFANRLTVVGFFTMNFGIVSGSFEASCDASGADCLANQTRVGGQARWNFMPLRRLDPWAGAGVAWEVLGLEATSGTSGVNWNYQGVGWDLQGGVDYWFSQRFSVSPFLGISIGTYKEAKLVSGFSNWEQIPNPSAHFLVTAGVRLVFDLGGTPRAEAPSGPVPGSVVGASPASSE